MSSRRVRSLTTRLLVGLGLVLVTVLPGSPCDSSTCALLTRGQNGLLAPGRWRVDVSGRHTDQSSRRQGSESTDEVLRPKVYLETGILVPAFHRDLDGRETFLQLDVARGMTRTTTAIVSLPLLARRSYRINHAGRDNQYTTQGIGDVVLGVRQSLGPAVLGLSLKTPTARNDLGGDFANTLLDPGLQPGSGSWDAVASLQHSRMALGLTWIAAGSVQWTTRNQYDFRFGREAILSAAASRPFGRVSASFQAKLFHKGRSRLGEQAVPSSGVTFLYVGSGATVKLPGALSAFGYLLVAPYRYVNEAQLAPRVSATLGLSKLF